MVSIEDFQGFTLVTVCYEHLGSSIVLHQQVALGKGESQTFLIYHS